MKEYITLIQNPREFFKSVVKENITTTLKKALPIIIVLFLVQTYIYYFISGKLNYFLGVSNSGIAFYFLTGIIVLPLTILVSAGLLILSLKILKSKSSFSQNLKLFLYAIIPIYSVSILFYAIILALPNSMNQILLVFIFWLISFIWQVIIIAIGISEFYKISVGKSVGAYFLIFGLMFAAMLALIMVLLIIILIALLLIKGFK